jgi:hypothetical protein
MIKKTEILSGYVVDCRSLRKWSTENLFEKARTHSKELLLLGHAIESGFALISFPSVIYLTDPHATPLILDILFSTESETGIQLRVERELQNDEMKSVLVTEV